MTIRILIVDDSVVIRKLLTQTLSEVAGLEVVASAGLGRIALAKIPQCNPDIVILDVEMPELDGIETLKLIRKDAPRLPVIMFSTRTERGASATIEALTCGASDYVTKPSNVGNVLLAMSRVREEMVPKILALTARDRPARPGAAAAPPVRAIGAQVTPAIAVPRTTTPLPAVAALAGRPPPPRARPATTGPIPMLDGPIRLARPSGPRPPVAIVAIGSSTGGPNALATLLSQLPRDLPVPIVIVQHMLATLTHHFTQRLASQCPIKIVEATAGEPLQPGCAYIARGDHHLLVERRAGRFTMATNQAEVENFCRPAVDVLFRSVAQAYGAGALAVVLTGMGRDGLLGASTIREAGGEVIVQDQQSSVVWGMPGFIARAGLASEVLPIEQLAGEIRRRVALGGVRAAGAGT